MGSMRSMRGGGEKLSPPKEDSMQPHEEPEFVKLDDLEVVTDDRRRGRAAVSINGKTGRIVLYTLAYRALCEGAGRKVEHIQPKTSPSSPGRFWICPCHKDDFGAKLVHLSGKTRLLSVKALVSKLGLAGQETSRYEAKWDPINQGLRVKLSQRI